MIILRDGPSLFQYRRIDVDAGLAFENFGVRHAYNGNGYNRSVKRYSLVIHVYFTACGNGCGCDDLSMSALIVLASIIIICRRVFIRGGEFWTWWIATSGIGGVISGLMAAGRAGSDVGMIITASFQSATAIALFSLLPAAICFAVRRFKARNS